MKESLADKIRVKDAMITDYIVLLEELTHLKQDYEYRKNLLYLDTDFKDLGLTNEKMRSAYVDNELAELKLDIEIKKVELESVKYGISVCNDWIRYGEHLLEKQ